MGTLDSGLEGFGFLAVAFTVLESAPKYLLPEPYIQNRKGLGFRV